MNDCDIDQGQSSIVEIDEKIASCTFMERVALLYRRVECLMRTNRYYEAVADLQSLLLLDASNPLKPLALLKECYAQIGDQAQLLLIEQRLAQLSSLPHSSDNTCHVSVSFNKADSSASLPRLHPVIEAALLHPSHSVNTDEIALAEAVRRKQFNQLKRLVEQPSGGEWCVVTSPWWRQYIGYLCDGGTASALCNVVTNSGVSVVLRSNQVDAEAVWGLAIGAQHWQTPYDMNTIGPTTINDTRLSFVLLPAEAWRALCVWCSNEQHNDTEKSDLTVTDVIGVSDNAREALNDWISLEDVLILLSAAEQRQRSASISSSVHVAPVLLCVVCKRRSELRCSKCRTVVYCSSTCQVIHWRYHKAICNASSPSAVDVSARGVAGLANLGNSCYLNCSLQCLSHIFPLTRYFVSGEYERDVNAESRDGAQGELAKEYATLLRDMWLKSKATGSVVVFPTAVKRVLGRLNSDYASLQQQDAHDVLEMLLDRLHEDVNLVLKKPYCEKAEGDGSNDLDVSREAWHKHGLRNRSLVGDVVGGMLRSYLRCPTCDRVSVTFDYHNTLQLAIPNTSSLSISVVWLPVSASSALSPSLSSAMEPYRVILEIDRLSSVLALKREICRKLLSEKRWSNVDGVELEHITLLMLERTSHSGYTASRLLDDDDSLSAIAGIESSEIGTYWSPPSARMKGSALILQSLPQSQMQQGKSTLVGYPLLIPFDYDWSVLRFRCEVWQQLCRIVARDRLGGFAPEGNMAADLRMGQRLCLRHCDRFGEAAALKKAVKTTAASQQVSSAPSAGLHGKVSADEVQWMHRAGLSATAQCTESATQDSYFNGLLPTNKDITMKDALGHADPHSIPFFCVSWTNAWQPYIDMKKLTCARGASMRPDGSVVKRDHLSLHRCLQHFTADEILDEENAWYCSKCKGHRQAHKKLSFWHLPDVLIVGLKRFEYRSRASMHELGRPRFSSYREKIDTFVDFPIDGLDMSPYCDPNSDSLGGSTIYDLFGVCNHYGRMGFGHYVAMARDWDVTAGEDDELGSNWYCYDDESVQPIDEKSVKTNAAYILFYRRRK